MGLEMGFLWSSAPLRLPLLPPSCPGPLTLEVDLKLLHQAPTKRLPENQLRLTKVDSKKKAYQKWKESPHIRLRPTYYWCLAQTPAMSLHQQLMGDTGMCEMGDGT